ncbi:MAG: DUF2834 domain-containing protein [Blastocatellia bacterium]
MKQLYLILTIIGLIAPMAILWLFIQENGWNPALFWQQMWGSRIAAMVMTDLLLSCLAAWYWMSREAKKHGIGNLWVYIAGTLGVGLCFALPLFLYVRQGRIEASAR